MKSQRINCHSRLSPTIFKVEVVKMVFKKNSLTKDDLDEEEPLQQCCTLALTLVAVFVLLCVALFTLLARGSMLDESGSVVLSSAEIEALQNEYYENALPLLQNMSQVVVCYYNMPLALASPQLLPRDIHPHLCTHINVAFAQIKNKAIYLQDHQRQTIADVVHLKQTNPHLKVLLSVGGAGSHSGFQEMVFNHTCRKMFIRSIKYTLRNLSLDGIDLDWEFPAVESLSGVGKRERQHFSQLLREIRMEYRREKRNYLLTVASAAPQIIVDAAYDVDQMDLYVDFVNIMTYDFHYYTGFTPLTGLNSPLFPRASEQLYFATLNINYTVGMYKSKGLSPQKIVVGIPTYAHSFTLANTENTKVGSPALGFGSLGDLGFVNYTDVCTFINKYHNETTINMDKDAKVPYFYRNSEWVSYDNPESVVEKARYIRDNNLRGAMIYSLNSDDYLGVCGLAGASKFPLAASVKNTLRIM